MDALFLFVLGLFLTIFLSWGFKYLPGERWQMLAVIPLRKSEEDGWMGLNLTYYGFFVATSQLIAVSLLCVLLGAIQTPLIDVILTILLILSFALPASKLVAILVEKKRHTFTIGGASFVGIIVAPWCVELVSHFRGETALQLGTIALLAALSIAYTLGEGLGRLGCLSYGCCYGKPLKECSRPMRWLFQRTGLIFYGSLKKVSYEAQLEGERLVPIQALTSVVYVSGALLGVYLFLHAQYSAALLFTISLTQLWRIFSETLRADFRGFSKISAYQKMGLVSVIYMAAIVFFLPTTLPNSPDIAAGISSLWQPVVILGLQLLWFVFFLFFGRSTITSANISFQLLKHRI